MDHKTSFTKAFFSWAGWGVLVGAFIGGILFLFKVF